MANVDDVVSAIQNAIEKVQEAVTCAEAAGANTEELRSMFATAGVGDKLTEFGVIRDTIERLISRLLDGRDLADEAIGQARSAAG